MGWGGWPPPNENAHQLRAIVPAPAQTYIPQRAQGALRPSGGWRQLRPVGCMRGLGRERPRRRSVQEFHPIRASGPQGPFQKLSSIRAEGGVQSMNAGDGHVGADPKRVLIDQVRQTKTKEERKALLSAVPRRRHGGTVKYRDAVSSASGPVSTDSTDPGT
jgi:hypothetical protein